MKPSTIEGRLTQEIHRLLADWDRQSMAAHRRSEDASLSPIERRVAAMQARTQSACITDIRDLLAGRPNPCDRRS